MVTKATRRNRGFVYAFGLYTALMLLQTPVANIGTINALGTMMLVIACAFFRGYVNLNQFHYSKETALLFFFLIVFVTSGFANGVGIGQMSKVLAFVLFALFLTGVSINETEANYIRGVFKLASFVYALLVIRSCMNAGDDRYFHGDISLFGTMFDPNYIGIPLVAASILFFSGFLNEKKKIVNGAGFSVVAIAIVYTASRGNMLSMLLGNSLCFPHYLFRREIKASRKLWWSLFLVGLLIMLVFSFSLYFPEQWERMTTYDEGADNGRFEVWEKSAEVFMRSPIWGNGFFSTIKAYGRAAHNTYIQVLCDTGILGFSFFTLLAVLLFRKTYKSDIVLSIVLLSMLFQTAFLDALENRPMWTIFSWLLLLPENTRR